MADSLTANLRSRKREKSIKGSDDIGSGTARIMDEETSEASINNTQQTIMTSGKEGQDLMSSRRTVSESSSEAPEREGINASNGNSNGMWRNELKISAESSSAQPEKQQQVQHSSFRHRNERFSDLVDVVLRIALTAIFFKLETMWAFKREIHAEELWLYKNPRRPDIVKGGELLFWVIVAPLIVTVVFYVFTKDKRDFRAASWAWTLALCMNGLPTSMLKITVGRPRPDFFYRCFPDGVMVLNSSSISDGSSILDFNCTGIASDINEGRKSFPSGHSSFAFASFGLIAYYVGAKLHAFDARGRGHTWRLCIAAIPLIIATLVAVSRTCDYHHHWQDVTVGAIIGLLTGYISYRQYYPSIFGPQAGTPSIRWPRTQANKYDKHRVADDIGSGGDILRRPLLGGKEQTKWY
ncbi:phospholipid phosphatase 5 [Drosophila madeirensis]|uniref:Phospholipid phosphatase 5 n=1 Tax=Drosophila madeirensis TaxID=30013 RepID=A0AAU9ES77_DROMD